MLDKERNSIVRFFGHVKMTDTWIHQQEGDEAVAKQKQMKGGGGGGLEQEEQTKKKNEMKTKKADKEKNTHKKTNE